MDRLLKHPSAVPVVAATVALVAAMYFYRPWLAHLDVPFDATGDALQKLQLALAATRHGWILRNPSIGLPGEGQHLDFPRYDSLNYLAIKLAAGVLPTPVAANVYYLLGFPIAGASAAWALSRFGISRGWSVFGGIAYAWLPYHPLQGFGHFTNACYGLVPLGVWLLWDIWHGPVPLRSRRWTWWVAAITIGSAIQLQNSYYGFFLALLTATYGAIAVSVRGLRESRDHLVASGALLGTLAVAFSLEQLPRWVLEFREGRNLLGLVRPLDGPTTYALSVANLLNPSPTHPIAALRDFAHRAAVTQGQVGNERAFVALPLVGLVGVVVMAVAAVALVRRAPQPTWTPLARRAAAVGLVVLLWAHEGALGTLMAEGGFSIVRSWNRMAVYFAFAAIVAAVAWLDGSTRRLEARKRTAILAGALLLTLGEQLGARSHVSYDDQANRLRESSQVVRSLTADASSRVRAFVLPYVAYPEAGPVEGIADYDHFGFLLASDQLSISYGSMRGRGSHYFNDATTSLAGAALLDLLERGGFNALIVDRASETARAKLAGIKRLVGAPVVETARYSAFRLLQTGGEAGPGFRDYDLGTRIDFGADVATRRFLQLNFSEYEPEGTWTLGPRASLRVRLTSAVAVGSLEIEGQLFEPASGSQRVTVSIDGNRACTLDGSSVTGSPGLWRCPLDGAQVGEGEVEIAFRVQQPVRPVEIGVSQDNRPLGFRLVALTMLGHPHALLE